MNTKDKYRLKFKELTILGDWIPRKVVKDFFGYGNTKMASFATDYNVTISRVGKRIFYSYKDLLRILEQGIIKGS